MTGHRTEVRRSSLHQNHKLAKDKALSPRANRGLRPREEDKPPKSYQQNVFARSVDGRHLFPSKLSSGYYQKPWLTADLGKHKPNAPAHVHSTERGGKIQEKPLNFGVLGWQRLEKWAEKHRRVTANDKAAVSPASRNGSLAFSAFRLSSKSCRSGGSRQVGCRNLSPLNLHQHSSIEEGYTLASEETGRSSLGYHSPEIGWSNCPASRRTYGSAEQCLRMDNLAAKLEEHKREILEPQVLSSDAQQISGARTLPSRLKDRSASHSLNGKLKTPEVASDCGQNPGELGHECSHTSLSNVVDFPQDRRWELSPLNVDMFEHSQESIQGGQRFSFGSSESAYTIRTDSARTSFVGILPCEDFQTSTSNVAYSCPLTSDVHKKERSDANACFAEHGHFPAQPGKLAMVRTKGLHEQPDKPTVKPHKSLAAKTPENWSWMRLKSINTRGRESLLDIRSHAGLSCMISGSRSREVAATRQPKWTSFLDGDNGDRAVDSSRARLTPLRRLLDPLLKPKSSNRIHTSKLAAGTPRQMPCENKLPREEELPSTRRLHSCSQASRHSCDSNLVKGFNSSRWLPMGNHGSVHAEKHETPTKRTLLQLAWKNGLPLFTLSVNEDDILAATRKTPTPGKEDCECIYTFYHVCETKKKIGSWIGQGNKSKRKGLISSVAGQMNVSSVRCLRNHFAVREFVLFGSELRPSLHGTSEPAPNSELAAIVVKVPDESIENFIGDLHQRNSCLELSKTNLEKDKYVSQLMGVSEREQHTEKNAPKVIAILPSEVHGLSETGRPSSLVDRWKSHGSCDCGGWDVGCSLTILTDKLRNRSAPVQACHNTENTNQVQLFLQGVTQESGPVFNLVLLREGLYTVDFHASMVPLQAFAVCIAILHSRKSAGPHDLQNPQ